MSEVNDLIAAVEKLVTENGKLKRDNAVMSDQLPMLHEKVKTLREENANLHERYVRASRKADAAGKPSPTIEDMGYTLTPEQVETARKKLDDANKRIKDIGIAKSKDHKRIQKLEAGMDAVTEHQAQIKRLERDNEQLSDCLKSTVERVATLEQAVNGGITPDAHTLSRLYTVEERVANRISEGDTAWERLDERLKLVEELCKLRFPTSDQDGVRYREYPKEDTRR